MPMMAISSEAKIHVQLLNCQINLSPFLRNNVGTKVIAKSTKAIIAMPHILIFFILPLVKFRFIVLITLQRYEYFPSQRVFCEVNLSIYFCNKIAKDYD